MSDKLDLTQLIRDVPDFPKPGIVFKDITPLLKDPGGLRAVVDAMKERLAGVEIDSFVAIESRGFIFGAALACELGVGCIPARKPGKLPCPTRSASFDLEYGQDSLEIHEDAISSGDRIVIVDDVLATGGTASAVCSLVEQMGGTVVTCAFLIELTFLEGRKALGDRQSFALVEY